MSFSVSTRQIAIIVAIIGIGSIVFLFSGATTKPMAKETITVGAILPLTGDLAFLGTSMQQGIEIAMEEINLAGGIKGKQVTVIFEDNYVDNVVSLTAAQKLISIDRIDVGIVPFVHCGKVIMPVFEQNQVPLILAWDSTQEIAPGDYIFSTGFSTEAAGKKMANFAFNQLNLRKTAIAFHQDEWSEIIAPSFKQEFESLGGTIVLEEGVLVGETDFKTIIEKIKSNGVDSVYLPFVPFGTDLFLKQAKELGLEAQLLSGDAMILDIIIAAGSAAEGVYFTNIFAEDNEVSQKLSEKYHEKYEIEPEALSIVAFGYDSMMTIKNAAESVETISSETIKDALYSVDFVGAGGQIKINPNGLSDRIEKVFVVQNGEPVLAE